MIRWSPDDRPVSDEDLSAFADGALPRRRAARVAAHLRSEPADADRIHAYWRREAALKKAFDVDADEPGPDADAALAAGRRRRVWPALVAVAAVAALTAGVGRLVWAPSPPDFTTAALEAYAEKVVRAQAVSDTAPPAGGLEPVGRRRIGSASGGLVEYRYRRDDGARVALYVAEREAPAAEGLFRLFERGDTRLVEWHADGKHYALVGPGGASELTRLAVRIRRELTAPPTIAGAADDRDALIDGPVIDTGGADGGGAAAPQGVAPVDMPRRGGEM